jgi:enoyl-CoA hydratase
LHAQQIWRSEVELRNREKDKSTGLARRQFLAAGTKAAAIGFAFTSPAFAQSQTSTSGEALAQPQNKSTVTLDRLPAGVLLIGIDRVEAQNRIDIPTFTALGQAYYEFEHDDGVRVAVLYGKGPDFSKGLDLPSWGLGLRARPFQAPPHFLDPLGTTGPDRSKPLVVAVQGHVTRIAHELFLAADVRVAAQDTVFNQGEVTAASFPGGGATIRFVREAGWGNAMRYMLTGADWRADDAYRMGLVQELTAPGQQLDRAVEFAKQVAEAAPLAVRATLASARRALTEGEKSALAALQPEFARLLRGEDRQEYLRALQENRAPVFVGR